MENLLRRSLHRIKTLQSDLDATREPIAVLGMACRLPGGCSTPEKFWDFLINKGDGVREVPPARWDQAEYYDPTPGTPGKMYIHQANFLQEDVAEFDARFFRISPLEAAEMDPQQRILLELSWEALERAGHNIDMLAESNTGVYIGIIGSDYGRLPRDPTQVNPYRGTGSVPSIASGRIAHVLGFHGPAISVDTTCSSSLVSVQLACDGLRRGHCDLALAGGVNMMLSPNPMISLCMMNALSTDGRCRPFDGDGQGYGRAEGAGLVVLERLSVAQRENHPVLAVIRGGAVNQDGPSSGLTVPNGTAQRELIQNALADAGLTGTDIGYLEAHGTGTALGDPIEIKAVQESLGSARGADNPLIIGSVKGNIGHLEGAAGISGLIKVVLCLQNRQVPPNIHLERPNPRVPLDRIPAFVPDAPTDWQPAGGRPRIAGVSSFGFSGTNAHVILAEAPNAPANAPGAWPLSLLTLSAKTEWALAALIEAYRQRLDEPASITLEDLCYTANTGRTVFGRRVALVASDLEQLRSRLADLAQGVAAVDTLQGVVDEKQAPVKPALLFSTVSAPIGRGLYDLVPAFRRALDQCDLLFRTPLDTSIREFLLDPATTPSASTGRLQQATSFAAAYALGRLLDSLEVKPTLVWGATRAETYAAACTAGVLTPQAAAALLLDPAGAEVGTLAAPKCRVIDPTSGQSARKSTLLQTDYWRSLPDTGEQPPLAELAKQGITHVLCPSGLAHLPSGMRQLHAPSGWADLIRLLAELYCAGIDVHWQALYEGNALPRKIVLPTYPFERKRYWSPLKPGAANNDEHARPARQAAAPDPLRGERVRSPFDQGRYEFAYRLDLARLPEARDTHGILHVGYYLEILARALAAVLDAKRFTLLEQSFLSALILAEEPTTPVHLGLEPAPDGTLDFSFHSLQGDGERWERHVQGRLRVDADPAADEIVPPSLAAVRGRCPRHDTGEDFYRRLADRNIRLGPAVQWVDEVWSTPGEVLARFKVPPADAGEAGQALGFHPGIIDACAQVFHAALPADTPPDMKFMVVKWHDFRYLAATPTPPLWCHLQLQDEGVPRGSIRGAFMLFDDAGKTIAHAAANEMKGLVGFNVRDLEQAKTQAKAAAKGAARPFLERLQATDPTTHGMAVTEHLRGLAAEVLGIPPADIEAADNLMDLGIDSMTGVMLQAAIERDTGVELPLDEIIQGPRIDRLGTELANRLAGTVRTVVPVSIAAPVVAAAPAAAAPAALWFVQTRPQEQARMRLFCLPYGGGGASAYGQWQERFPSALDVCAIQLPHRENRLREPLVTDLEVLVEQLLEALPARMDLPWAFYGHSMGALIAYRLACRLDQAGLNAPEHLFVGGYSSPSIQPNPLLARTTERLRALGMEGIPRPEQVEAMSLEQLDAFGEVFTGFRRIPEEVQELRRLLLPILVGDLGLVASFRPEGEGVLDCPITVFHGVKDEQVLLEESRAWAGLTRVGFALHELPGDHLFLQPDQCRDGLIRLITTSLGLDTDTKR